MCIAWRAADWRRLVDGVVFGAGAIFEKMSKKIFVQNDEIKLPENA